MSKRKSKGLKNPVAIAAATTGTEMAIRNAPKAAKAAGERADKINADTGNMMSWVLLAAVAAGVFVFWRISSNAAKVTNVVGSAADVASNTLDQIAAGIANMNNPSTNPGSQNQHGNAPIVPSISPAQAQAKSTILFQAMNQFGTDFPRLKEALTGINVADYVLIANAFGTPRYNGFKAGAWPAPERNLSYWIAAELDNNQLHQIKSLLPGIF